MADLLNPRSREDVRNNSFGDYAEGLLSNTGNSVKDWYTGMHPMDQVAVATAPIPLLGDITGAAADARMFYEEPESRTWANAGMSAAGLLPFVPALSIAGRKAKTLNPNAPKRPLTEFEQAHSTAQKNAALPTSEGGLGLPKDNTAIDRAKAMGFDVDKPLYHGTDGPESDIRAFELPGDDVFGKVGRGVYQTSDPVKAGRYAEGDGGNVIPAYNRGKMASFQDAVDVERELGAEVSRGGHKAKYKKINDALRDKGFTGVDYGVESLIFEPKNIRSPNAAFDPMKRDSSDLLSSAGLLGGYGNRRSFA